MEMTETRPIKTIFTQKLAGYLMQRGFVLVDIKPNRKYPNKHDFLFADSPQLQQAILDYKSM